MYTEGNESINYKQMVTFLIIVMLKKLLFIGDVLNVCSWYFLLC